MQCRDNSNQGCDLMWLGRVSTIILKSLLPPSSGQKREKAASYCGTLVPSYQTMQCHITGDWNCNIYCRETYREMFFSEAAPWE